MEPRARAEEEVIPDGTRFRWRLLAACVLLTGLAMTQSPGLLVPDTKLDLAVAPLDFLSRAAHLWDAEGAFGQLQNQAYGYLWPMGPFFALGELLDVPGWVVQRLWMALVLCVAFTGAAKLCRALGVRADLACLLGGFAYALSPRMLTVLGPSSIEVWPMALAPWVLLPLVVGAERGSPRRAAALSALAVGMVGGVNAAATSAVLPLGALWLLTRRSTPRRRALMLWWPTFTLLATLWWLVPLFLLGTYSPPFLDFIESAGITTFPTTLFDALRGSSNWVAYVDAQSAAGLDLIRVPYLVLNTGLLAAAGLAGLALTRNSHRRFLVLGVFVGLFLVTMGHTGTAEGLFAEPLKTALDELLAPLRNVHKFDVVLRLPLVVGLAYCVEEALERRRSGLTRTGAPAARVTAGVVLFSVLLATGASALPAVRGDVAASDGFEDIPEYWRDAAAWLEEHDDHGVTLLVPGSSFGSYVWGEPRDEPMQAIAGAPWAVRNAVPLVPAGNIRMLDEIEQRLTRGDGGRGLARYLARAGISKVMVRNDLVRSEAVADPVLVHQALDGSPGLRRVADFGPQIGGESEIQGRIGRALVNGGWQSTYPALEVYDVDDAGAFSTGVSAPPVVVGGPEDLLSVGEAGLLGDEPAVLAADADPEETPAGPVILTDGLRRVERHFGRLHDASSPTLTPEEGYTLRSVVHDYELGGQSRWSTTAELAGARTIGASSSSSEAATPGGSRVGDLPYAAMDGDDRTAWVSAPYPDEPQAWWVDFGRTVSASEITVGVGAENGAEELRLRAGDWTSPLLSFDAGETRKVAGPGSLSGLQVEDASGRARNVLALTEVQVGDTSVSRSLVLPELPARWGDPAAILLRRLGDSRTGCAVVDGDLRCRQSQRRPAEEVSGFARSFSVAEGANLPIRVTASSRAGAALDRLVQADQVVSVSTSGNGVDDPRASATAMIDGDPGTTWYAPPGDIRPQLQVNFLGAQDVRGIALGVSAGTAARAPQVLELSWPGGRRTVDLDEDGTATFAPITTSRLTIQVRQAEPATDLDFDGRATDVPVGIGELRLTGVPSVPLALSERPRRLPCGTGPTIVVNGRSYSTQVTASAARLASGQPVDARVCTAEASVPVRDGENSVVARASAAFVPDTVVLGGTTPGSGVPLTTRIGPSTRSVESSGGADYVVTRENANRGWTAGPGPEPQVFDGWRQGWRTSPGAPELVERFAPDRAYRFALGLGALAALVLLGALVAPARRPRDAAPAAASRRDRRTGILALVAASVLLLGWPGGLVSCAAVGAVAVVRRARPTWEGWGVPMLLAPVLAAGALRPWGGAAWAGSLWWPPYLVLLACSAVGAWVLLEPRERRPRRLAGRSTPQ